MKIAIPGPIQQRINRVDRQRSLMIGISAGLLALWSLYRAVWSLYYIATYNFLFGSLVFNVVLWGLVGAAATLTAGVFLYRYAKTPAEQGSTED